MAQEAVAVGGSHGAGHREAHGTGESGASLVEHVGRTHRFTSRQRIAWEMGQRASLFRRQLGLEHPNALQRVYLASAARTWWLLRSVDEYVAQHSLEGYNRPLTLLLKERTALAARLERDLTLLAKARGILASTPTTTAPPAPSPSSKAKRKDSGKAKDSRDPADTPSSPT